MAEPRLSTEDFVEKKIADLKHSEPNLPKEFYSKEVISFLMLNYPEKPLSASAREFHEEFKIQSERLAKEYPYIDCYNNFILLSIMMQMNSSKDSNLYEKKIDSVILDLFKNKDHISNYTIVLNKIGIEKNQADMLAKKQCYTIPRSGFVKIPQKIKDVDIGESSQAICAISPFGMLASEGISHKEMYKGKRSVPLDTLISILKLPSNANVDLSKDLKSPAANYVSYIGTVVQKRTHGNQALAIYNTILDHWPRYISPASLGPVILNSIVWAGTLAIEIPLKTIAAMMTNAIRTVSKPLFDKNASLLQKLGAGIGTFFVGAILYVPSQILFAVGNLASYTRGIFDGLCNLVSLGLAKLGEKLTKTSHVDKYPTAELCGKTIGGNALSFITGGLPFLAGLLTIFSNEKQFKDQQALKETAQEKSDALAKDIGKDSEKSENHKKAEKKSEKISENTQEIELGQLKTHESSADLLSNLTSPPPAPEQTQEQLEEQKQRQAIDSWIMTATASLAKVDTQMDLPPSILKLNSNLLALKKETGDIMLDSKDPYKKQEITDICKQLDDKNSEIQKKLPSQDNGIPKKQQTAEVEIEMQPVRMKHG